MNFETLNDNKLTEILINQINAIKHLFNPFDEPEEGDGQKIYEESHKNFQEYIESSPVRPVEIRKPIYIQPIGNFSEKERKVINLTSEFIGIFFNLSININPDLPLDIIPDKARRNNPEPQLNTRYIIYQILIPRFPKDAAVFIASTTIDLWPENGWNFVFGEAEDLVGVWSLNRFGDANGTKDEFQRCLLRAMKIATHETVHTFSLNHCIGYKCTMNHSNSLKELDRNPLMCCPDCMAKICWILKTDPISRYKKIKKFCQGHGFIEEQRFFCDLIEVLQK
ncbi:MAG: archaemetzincin [Promethearchaeota archaeon]